MDSSFFSFRKIADEPPRVYGLDRGRQRNHRSNSLQVLALRAARLKRQPMGNSRLLAPQTNKKTFGCCRCESEEPFVSCTRSIRGGHFPLCASVQLPSFFICFLDGRSHTRCAGPRHRAGRQGYTLGSSRGGLEAAQPVRTTRVHEVGA